MRKCVLGSNYLILSGTGSKGTQEKYKRGIGLQNIHKNI